MPSGRQDGVVGRLLIFPECGPPEGLGPSIDRAAGPARGRWNFTAAGPPWHRRADNVCQTRERLCHRARFCPVGHVVAFDSRQGGAAAPHPAASRPPDKPVPHGLGAVLKARNSRRTRARSARTEGNPRATVPISDGGVPGRPLCDRRRTLARRTGRCRVASNRGQRIGHCRNSLHF